MKLNINLYMRLKSIQILLLLLLFPLMAFSQSDERTQSRERLVLFGIGSQNVLDTYLSPLEYTGANLGFHSSTLRPLRWCSGGWTYQRSYWADLGFVSSPTEDNDEWDGQFQIDWAWRRVWTPVARLQLAVGPMLEVGGGFTYSMRGGNNPAQGRLALSAGASAAARYDFEVWKKAFALNARLDIPLLGAAFSPRFGQSYYEIFSLGHYDRNVVMTHLGNAPTARVLCTLSAPIGRSRLHIGYRGEARQSRLHHLKRHSWLNTLMIGYSFNFRILHP